MATDNDEPIVGSPGWVDDGRLWTATELEKLTPDQHAELLRQRRLKVLTFDDLDPEFAEKVRVTARRLGEERRGRAPG